MSIDGKLQLRHDVAANWASFNPVLGVAEPAYVDDTGVFKIGNGTTRFQSLPGFKNATEVDAAVQAAQASAVTANNTALQVQAALASLSPTVLAVPGALVMFPSTTAPAGYLKCNGAGGLLRSDFPLLWAFIQGSGILAASEATKQPWQFGPGNGTTTFSLIDARGYALRAWDDGRGVDPGRGLGTYQQDQIKEHGHDAYADDAGTHGHGISDPGHAHGVSDAGHTHGINDPGHAHNLGDAFGLSNSAGDGLGFSTGIEQRLNTISPSGTGISIQTAGTGVGVQANGTGIAVVAAGTHSHAVTVEGITGGGATETTMKNVAYLLCIKF